MIEQVDDIFGIIVQSIIPWHNVGFSMASKVDGDHSIGVLQPIDLRLPHGFGKWKGMDEDERRAVSLIGKTDCDSINDSFHRCLLFRLREPYRFFSRNAIKEQYPGFICGRMTGGYSILRI